MSEFIGAGATWPGHLQWHGEMHRKLGGRSLHFWFMRLSELYEKEKAFAQIVECMEAVDAVAYAGYELSGEFDVMLRVWLPASRVGKFAELLKEKLRPTTSRYYPVIRPVRHWVWEKESDNGATLGNNGGGPGLIPCDIDSLDPATLIEDIETLNRLSDVSHRLATVNAEDPKEAAVFDRFREAKAVKPVSAENGIRLVLRLRPSFDVTDEDLHRITEGITSQLDGLREPIERPSAERSSVLKIREFSLYACEDGWIIVLCRIDYRAWHLIREQLLTPLGKIPGLAQTTTFPVLSASLEISREALMLDGEVRNYFEPEYSKGIFRKVVPNRLQSDRYKIRREEPLDPADLPKPPPGPLAVREFFDREEGTTFEAKGSAFAPLEDWLNRGVDASEDAGLKENKGFFRSTIAKSIVAMLNTEGGVILIGVLEADRYAVDSRERVRLRLEAFPREGRFRLLGLQDPTYRKKRWDGFDRKFHELLTPMIDGITQRRIQLFPGWHEGREFAIVRVHGPGPGLPRRGFYLKDDGYRFLIRRGGRIEQLHGNAIHEYLDDDPNTSAE
jgi:Putative DNA-binding domain